MNPPYPSDGCPKCDPEHAPKTEAAREWLLQHCWGRGRYHPYVEHDFHETAEMLRKVEAQAVGVMPLADALHAAAATLIFGEALCWCRRICTVDGTHDDEQDPKWNSRGIPYDPGDWGESAQRPTYCEQAAAAIIEHMLGGRLPLSGPESAPGSQA